MTTLRGTAGSVRVASLPLGGVLELPVAARRGGLASLDDLWAPVDGPGRLPGRAWFDAVAPLVDVAHVHVGREEVDPAELRRTLGELQRLGVPVLVTVHALGPEAHGARDAAVEVALGAAAAVVAPSLGVARELLRRWDRASHVLPYPTVLPGSTIERMKAPGRARFLVGLDLTRRPPADDPATIAVIADAARLVPGVTLRVTVRPGSAAAGGVAGPGAADRGVRTSVLVRDPLPAHAVAEELHSLDALVVAEGEPGHVPWVRACLEAGTVAIVPADGPLAEQGPRLTYRSERPETLVRALQVARRTATWGAEAARDDTGYLVLGYRELYAALAAERRRPGSDEGGATAPAGAGGVVL